MRIVPITFRAACAFVALHHRHNAPPRGMKFAVGLEGDAGALVGVATAGRPVGRALDDGFTLEVNRTCTDGTRNANSMLYGAGRAVAKAMGYRRVITYIQAGESGASLKAAGFVFVKDILPRAGWRESSGAAHKGTRHGGQLEIDGAGDARRATGNVARQLWEIVFFADRNVDNVRRSQQ